MPSFPAAPCAPRNDLALLCTLSEYPSTEIARVATTAFERHLWYLSEILIAFAFFDDAVSTEEKRLMVAALREVEGQDEPLKRIPPFQHPNTKTLHNFVTKTQIISLRLLAYPRSSYRLIRVNGNVTRSTNGASDLSSCSELSMTWPKEG